MNTGVSGTIATRLNSKVKCQNNFEKILEKNEKMKARKIILKRKLEGLPKESDYETVEVTLPPIKDGEFLVEAHYISVDPYMRIFTPSIGATVFGDQIAKVIQSKNDKFPEGQFIIGEFGWTTHSVAKEESPRWSKLPPRPLPDSMGDLPKSLPLGVLGMPGNTAYFGFLKYFKAKPGNVVVISAAGGAVGSHVGQIAKIYGCFVVGIAGSDEKGKWLTNDLNFDKFVNYKKPDFEKKLAEAVPQGIDLYYDNVGGQLSHSVLAHMKKHGTFLICGSIATYVTEEIDEREEYKSEIDKFQLKLDWVNVFKWRSHWNEGIEQNLKWIKEGKLKYHETITEGFDNVVRAFIGLFLGENQGKAIVKVK